MDDIETAQLKLEGRCVHCKEKLPNHLPECIKHPRHDVLKSIKGINFYLKKVLDDISKKAEDNNTRKQLEEIIAKIKK